MHCVCLEDRKEGPRAKPWMVDISAKLSESGRRERHFFKTKKMADGFISRQNIRLKNTGTDSSLLSPAEREASMQALKLLGDENPLKLVEIVREWKKREEERLASAKMCDVWDKFVAIKHEHSVDYRNQIKSTRNRFQKHEEILVADLKKKDVEEALGGYSKSAFNGYLRVIRTVLNFALKQGWAKRNATEHIDFKKFRKKKEVALLTNLQTARLLVACRRHFVDDLPYFLFGLFSGIRPDELERMTWEMVRLADRNIALPPDVTKTGSRRVIVMEPTLCAWLRWFAKRPNAGALKGPIVRTANLRKRLREVRKKAKFRKWPQDVMRHTYASNHLAAKENIERLLLNLGHTSPATLWKHYHRAVTTKEAKQFWSLYPGSKASRIAKKSKAQPSKKAARQRQPDKPTAKRVRKRVVKATALKKSRGVG